MAEQHPFKGRHFQAEIILLCVRWYVRYPLSYRDLKEIMKERGLSLDHTTIYRWVQYYAPELEKRCRPYLKTCNNSWKVDETYIKGKKIWMYLYRAVDSQGNTLAFLLSQTRDAEAAKRFFLKALPSSGCSVHPADLVKEKGFCQNSNNLLAEEPDFCYADRIKAGFKKEYRLMNCPYCAATGPKRRRKKTKLGSATVFCPQCHRPVLSELRVQNLAKARLNAEMVRSLARRLRVSKPLKRQADQGELVAVLREKWGLP